MTDRRFDVGRFWLGESVECTTEARSSLRFITLFVIIGWWHGWFLVVSGSFGDLDRSVLLSAAFQPLGVLAVLPALSGQWASPDDSVGCVKGCCTNRCCSGRRLSHLGGRYMVLTIHRSVAMRACDLSGLLLCMHAGHRCNFRPFCDVGPDDVGVGGG